MLNIIFIKTDSVLVKEIIDEIKKGDFSNQIYFDFEKEGKVIAVPENMAITIAKKEQGNKFGIK